jgi:hypothetical protein
VKEEENTSRSKMDFVCKKISPSSTTQQAMVGNAPFGSSTSLLEELKG